MGNMTTPPEFGALALLLRDHLGITRFVETGCYHGDTTAWAAQHFSKVISIEIRWDFIEIAASACRPYYPRVSFIEGDSRDMIGPIVELLTGPALFWLDGHNATKLFGDGPDDCPVLEELAAINRSRFRHAIMIDDAHCFEPPVEYANWPDLDAVRREGAKGGYALRNALDCLVLLDRAALPLLDGTAWRI